jgi:Uma2 family endonuclease
MSKTVTKIGPADNGRRMSLAAFELAEGQEGYPMRIGVKEYWIVDPDKKVMVVMRQSRGRWVEMTVKPPAMYRTRLLPGLAFSIDAVFQAAGLS